MNIVDMKVNDWINITDNPIQRDTERRALKAKHLKTQSETHQIVAAAQFNNKTFKVDGHTRAYLWDNNKINKPNSLKCIVFEVQSMKAVTDLYKCFDSSVATENHSDKQHGALKDAGILAQSDLIRFGGLNTACRIIYGKQKYTIYELAKKFLHQLLLIDKQNYVRQKFPSGIYGALIATVVKDGDKAFDFWNKYNQEVRTIIEVADLREKIIRYRAEKKMQGHAHMNDLLVEALKQYEKYTNKQSIQSIKNFKTQSYMEGTNG